MEDVTLQQPATISFQGKHNDEEFQFSFYQHWIRLLWPVIRTVTYAIVILIVGYLFLSDQTATDPLSRNSILIVLTIAFIGTQGAFVMRVLQYFLTIVVVTDKKIHRIKKTLLFIDDHQSIDLWVLQDIDKRQRGIVQNLLGFGTITLFAQETEVRLHFTPGITEKYEKLMELRERARARSYMGRPPPVSDSRKKG